MLYVQQKYVERSRFAAVVLRAGLIAYPAGNNRRSLGRRHREASPYPERTSAKPCLLAPTAPFPVSPDKGERR